MIEMFNTIRYAICSCRWHEICFNRAKFACRISGLNAKRILRLNDFNDLVRHDTRYAIVEPRGLRPPLNVEAASQAPTEKCAIPGREPRRNCNSTLTK